MKSYSFAFEPKSKANTIQQICILIQRTKKPQKKKTESSSHAVSKYRIA